MSVRLLCACILLFGCAKQISLKEPVRPIYNADHTYGYYANAQGDWTVVSKVGPEKAVKELCPHGAVCTVETAGTMYRVRRIH